jgi:hypothetical protein
MNLTFIKQKLTFDWWSFLHGNDECGNRFQNKRYFRESVPVDQINTCVNVTKQIHTTNIHLGNGHFPLCRSSSLNFFNTSSKRCNNAVIANRPATPLSPLSDAIVILLLLPLPAASPNNENCSNVSKHVLANSSRNFISCSQPIFAVVAEWIEPLFSSTTTFKINCCGISNEWGNTSSRNNSMI